MKNEPKNLSPFILQNLQKAYILYPTVTHDLLFKISSFHYSIDELHWLTKNLYCVVKHFPRLLSAILTNIENTIVIEQLLKNYGHTPLFPSNTYWQDITDLLHHLGVSTESLDDFIPCEGVTVYLRNMQDLCLHYPSLEGIASVVATGHIISQMIPTINALIQKNFSENNLKSILNIHAIFNKFDIDNINQLLTFKNKQEQQQIEHGLHLGTYYFSRLCTDLLHALQHNISTTAYSGNLLQNTLQEPISKSYPLAEGTEAIERLAILNTLYNKRSIEVVQNCVHAQTKNILEIGCGVGIFADTLAKQIPSTVHVLATDASVAQINVCKTTYPNQKNLSFAVCDCQDFSTLSGKFDIIYARWMIVYQKNIPDIIHSMVQMLNPGGYLILEDLNPMHIGCYVYDKLNITELWNNFWKFVLIKTGRCIDLEKLILDTYKQLHMRKVEKRISQGVLTTKKEKALFYMCIQEIQPYILDMGVSKSFIDHLLEKLKEICDSQYPVDFARNFQIIAQK